MHLAAWSNNLETVEILLKSGCEVDARDADGRTALFLTSAPAVIDILVKHGASMDVVDRAGENVLHVAARRDEVAKIQTLQRLGADILAPHRCGRNAVSLAVISNHSEALSTLLVGVDRRGSEDKVCFCSGISARSAICSNLAWVVSEA